MVNTLHQANSKNQRNPKHNFPCQTYKQISIVFLGRKLADWVQDVIFSHNSESMCVILCLDVKHAAFGQPQHWHASKTDFLATCPWDSEMEIVCYHKAAFLAWHIIAGEGGHKPV